MNRLLFVSYTFPPDHTAEALLASRTVKALAKLGWSVTVLTIREGSSLDPRDGGMPCGWPPAVEIVRTSNPERRIFLCWQWRGVMKKILGIFGLPEVQWPWIVPARRRGQRLIDKRGYDAVLSWANYQTSSLVGLALKQSRGLPWVAHWSDPWTGNPLHPLTGMQTIVCRKLERKILERADALVFTTSQTEDLVMAKYPAPWRRKCHVIPHGYDSDILKDLVVPREPHQRLRLIYTGAFYGSRTPESFLRALSRVNRNKNLAEDLEVIFVGPAMKKYANMAKNMGVGGIVRFLGRLSFGEAQQKVAEADVLMVIDAPSVKESIFLPSKLVDYLMFQKPILGITPLEGASADVLRRLGHRIVAPDDCEGIAQSIFDLLRSWDSGDWPGTKADFTAAEEYDILRTTRHLDRILKSLIERREQEPDFRENRRDPRPPAP